MKAFLAITDSDWFAFLWHQAELAVVNFWQPSDARRFRALAPGQRVLFNLHAPHYAVSGGRFFPSRLILLLSLAWGTFGYRNGGRLLLEEPSLAG